MDLADLVKAIEEEFGISAAAPMAVAAAPAAGVVTDDAPSAAADEQTEFDVTLADFGANKINVIKGGARGYRPGPARSQGAGGIGPRPASARA